MHRAILGWMLWLIGAAGLVAEIAPEGTEYIVAGYREKALTAKGWRNCNLRTPFKRILKRAGLVPWPRLFHTLRASRETELA